LVTGAVACLLSGSKAAGKDLRLKNVNEADIGLKPSEVREMLLSTARNFTIQKPGEKPRPAKKLVLRPFPDKPKS
jgi:hypothetical protein